MIREIYQQVGTDPVRSGRGITSLELTRDIFEDVWLFTNFHSFDPLASYEASHKVQWRGREGRHREHRLTSSAYAVAKADKVHFNDKMHHFNVSASPDVGSRIFLSYITSKTTANLVPCTREDGLDQTFRYLLFNGGGRINPFDIKRLDGLQMEVDNYLAEVTLDGIMLGSDSELLVEEGVAKRRKNGLIILNKNNLQLVQKEIAKARENPRYFEFGGNTHEELTQEFYHTMHRKLDDIFRKSK